MLKDDFLKKWKKKMYMLDYYDKNPSKFGVKKHRLNHIKSYEEDMKTYHRIILETPDKRKSRHIKEYVKPPKVISNVVIQNEEEHAYKPCPSMFSKVQVHNFKSILEFT